MGRPSDTELSEPPVLKTWRTKYLQLYNVLKLQTVSLYLKNPGMGKNAKQLSVRTWFWAWHASGERGRYLRLVVLHITPARVYVCCVIFLVLPHGFSSKLETIRSLHPCGRHGGLMVSTQASGSSGPSLYPSLRHCVVFLEQDTLL